MDIEKFKRNGYAYSDIKVEEEIIDKLAAGRPELRQPDRRANPRRPAG